MTVPEPVVAALQFTEPQFAQELATWCEGEVAVRDDGQPVILVPSSKGPKPAHLGDWIVRRGEGDCYPCTPEKFALLHEPLV